MTIIEKIKNEENLSNALPDSIKCGLCQNEAVDALQDEHNAYIATKKGRSIPFL